MVDFVPKMFPVFRSTASPLAPPLQTVDFKLLDRCVEMEHGLFEGCLPGPVPARSGR